MSQLIGRRTLLGAAAAAAAGVGAASAPAAGALPSVNMELVVVQAQVEPFRGRSALAGDAAVKHVQSALDAKGFSTVADGYFGTGTRSDYAAWQRRLGHSGLGANGIPGPGSLTQLGQDRYTVARRILVGAKVSYQGMTINERTRAMLRQADSVLPWTLRLSQGSYNPGGDPTSAGTHDGGGVIDLHVDGLTTTQRWRSVKALRTVGFAAWLRSPSQGDWPWHIHAVAVGDTDMAVVAANQVADYYVGRNGLANHLADDTPADYRVPFTWWENHLRG